MNKLLASLRRSRWLPVVLEVMIAAAVFAGGYHVAYRYLAHANAPTFIDWELKPAVMVSCGRGLTEPAVRSPAVDRFVRRQTDSVSCQEFAGSGATTPAIGIAQANRYSLYGAAWAMRLGGVSWHALDAYLAFLYGLSMLCIYGLFRMAAGRVLAVCGAVALTYSPMLVEIVTLRDFIKLPCFTALWLVLAWVIRRGLGAGARSTVLPMAVGGALLGIGIGLRMDALILVPLFVLVVALAVPGFGRRDVAMKGFATLAFAAMFLVTGGPILKVMSSGSNSAHVVVLGLMQPFDIGLSVEPAPYDVGTHYSDGYAYTVIASHGLLSQGERLPIILGSAEYDRIGGRFLGTLARQFPADVIARALGATFQIFRFPFDWRVREYSAGLPTFQASAAITTIVEWRTWALGFFEGRERAATLFVLVLASAFNWRLGAIGLALVLYLCGYSMLQFSRRHIFHLDVIPIFMAVLALQLPAMLAWRLTQRFREGREAGLTAVRFHTREMLIGAALVAAGLVLLGGALRGAQAWQQRSVTGLVNATLRADWAPATVTEESLTDLILENGNPVASWYDIYHRDPELWKDATLLRVAGVVPLGEEADGEGDLRQQYFRVILEPRCEAREVLVGLKYSGAGTTFDYEYTRAFRVRMGQDGHTELLVPAYYHLGSTWNRLDGFGVPSAHRGCVTRVFRARQPSSLPLPVASFLLAPDWRERPLFQRVMARPKITIAGTPVDPLPDDESVHRSGWRRNDVEPLALVVPPLDAWDVGDGVVVAPRGEGFSVAGNTVPSGYQLVSPPLDVPRQHVVAVQIVGEVTKGEMCVGVLDGAQQRWLLPPSDARVGLLADTQDYEQVRLVFSNCARPPGEFHVRAIRYEAFPPES